jgi:hypothetical protein
LWIDGRDYGEIWSDGDSEYIWVDKASSLKFIIEGTPEAADIDFLRGTVVNLMHLSARNKQIDPRTISNQSPEQFQRWEFANGVDESLLSGMTEFLREEEDMNLRVHIYGGNRLVTIVPEDIGSSAVVWRMDFPRRGSNQPRTYHVSVSGDQSGRVQKMLTRLLPMFGGRLFAGMSAIPRVKV